jgi:hypothetical protein
LDWNWFFDRYYKFKQIKLISNLHPNIYNKTCEGGRW